MALDFNKMLETKAGDVERPVLAPIGTYIMLIKALPKMDLIADGAYQKVSFRLQGVEPTEDVQEAFEAWPGKIENVGLNLDFLFDMNDEDSFAKTQYAMAKFLTEHLGLDPSLSLGEQLSESLHCQCMVSLTHRQDKRDAEGMFLNVAKTAPVS